MDIIGKIYPPSSKKHSFILVATDYFTKWVEAASYKNITQKVVKEFIEERIIHRYGIPETITADQGTVFTGQEVLGFTRSRGIKMLHSTPYYAQANGQAEASNKVIINLIKRHLEENPREWDSLLSTVLWAYRTSRRSSTGVSPYMLTYGQEAVLPVEITVQSLRVKLQGGMSKEEYDELMYENIDELGESRVIALEKLIAQKNRVAKAYNKHVKEKRFDVGDLVWKTVLPVGLNNEKFGKWSPNWEGPYLVTQVLSGNAYHLMDIDGLGEMPRSINGKYLKKYYPTMWDMKEHQETDNHST
ncbi:uncharacterized protein LOC130138162 [Syzygium oleosum]|uniref:uncharacterized protein LOC130138162 n=1 Tax=Syzygium oleosum TaxID=219896 RepID=UPI0024B9F577|nr:uncharacterized protein LOC130138162 [Syzygium oleosum]